MSDPLKIACIGCGARAQTYASIAARLPDRFQIVVGAEGAETIQLNRE